MPDLSISLSYPVASWSVRDMEPAQALVVVPVQDMVSVLAELMSSCLLFANNIPPLVN